MKIIARLSRISGLISTDKPGICGMKDSPTPITSSAPSVRCLSSLWLNQNILGGGLDE